MRLGALMLVLYTLEGALGLPVFSEFRAGVMLPSFGYILGFILAAGLVGYLAERGWDKSPWRMFAAMLLGAAILYVPGLAWLSVWLGSFAKAITFGLTPFIAGDVLKAAIAALGFPAAWALISRR
jgi:biotin transport system substrate-specific component